MTPQERESINELLEAATINGATIDFSSSIDWRSDA